MRANRWRDTTPELELRSILHRMGLRYFVNRPPIRGLRRRADIVFPTARVAVYVDGCFWHGCPEHATWPKANAAFWRAKIEANRARDADTSRLLEKSRWRVVRMWEHEDPHVVARKIARLVGSRLAVSGIRAR